MFGIVGLTYLLGGAIIFTVLGAPDVGTAIRNQPQSLAGFLADIVFLTWGLTAVGEELLFRGFVLQRLLILAEQRPPPR